MEQIGKEIEKILKAGLGAVAAGVEKTQEAVEYLAEKGEPIYAQAKSAVCDAAGKIKKAVDESGIADVFSCPTKVEIVIGEMQEMTQQELDEVRRALEEIYPTRPSGKEEEHEAETQRPESAEKSDNESFFQEDE